MEEKKVKVKQTTFFSDGSEFTEEFGVNPNAQEIEEAVANAVSDGSEEAEEAPLEVPSEEIKVTENVPVEDDAN